MQINNVKSERGFTLVELIMVLVVTGILASALVTPFISGVRNATVPEIYSTAVYIAQSQMEQARCRGYSNTSTGTANTIGGIGTAWSNTTTGSGPTQRYYNTQVVANFISYNFLTYPPTITDSVQNTAYIRVNATVINPKISNVTMWTILPKGYYDPAP